MKRKLFTIGPGGFVPSVESVCKRALTASVVVLLLMRASTGHASARVSDPVVNGPNPKTGIQLSLADFFVDGQRQRTAYEALALALEACRGQRAARLVIPPGRYLFDDPAIAREPARPHVLFRDLEDLTVDGQGAELVFRYIEPYHNGLEIVNCRRLAIRNLVVDWDVPLASPGIVQAESDGRKSIRIQDGYPADETTRFACVSRFDLDTLSWYRGLANFEKYGPRAVTQVAPRTYTSPDFASFPVGAGVIVRHYVYGANAYLVGAGSSDITFEGNTIYGAPGNGFVVWNAERGFRVSGCTIARRPGTNRVYSTTADGAHFNNLVGDVIVENCDFGYQGDDAVNIHSTWMVARSVVDARTVDVDSLGVGNIVAAGDQIRFVRDFDLRAYTTLTVESSTDRTPRIRRVRFTSKLPPEFETGDRAANLSRSCSGYVVRGNRFHDNRARGMLIQSPNGLAEENRIERAQMAGLQITASDTDFHEGPGCSNLVVRNNTFVGCNYGSFEIFQAGRNMACVNVTASVTGGLSPAPVHRAITLDRNRVVDTPGLAYLLSSCEDVTFTNNVAERANTVAWSEMNSGAAIFARAAGSLMVTRASNITLGGYRELVFSGTTDKGIVVDPTSTSKVREENTSQGWIIPVIEVARAGTKELRIEGSNFDGALRVIVNGREQTKAVGSRSSDLLVLKGTPKRLGLQPGGNTVQVINPLETPSNVYSLEF